VFKVDIRDSAELQDLVRALKGAEKAVAQSIRAQTRKVLVPEWKAAVVERAETIYEVRLAGTARVAVSDQNVTMQAAKVRGTKFSGGLDLRDSWSTVERGANLNKTETYDRKSKRGGTHTVTRHTMHAFRPRKKGGHVLGPARQEIGPRALSLWVQTAVKTLYDSIERK
jgi:hypothetical protein